MKKPRIAKNFFFFEFFYRLSKFLAVGHRGKADFLHFLPYP